jgi:hypothetical protein
VVAKPAGSGRTAPGRRRWSGSELACIFAFGGLVAIARRTGGTIPTFTCGLHSLLDRLWRLVSLRLNFFTSTHKAVGYTTTTATGRRKRIYDQPKTPWQRVQASGVLDEQQQSTMAARVEGINPAELTRQINAVQMRLLDLAQAKTEALAAARRVDLEALQPSIDRLAEVE